MSALAYYPILSHVHAGTANVITRFSGTIVGLGKGVDTARWQVGQNVVVYVVRPFRYSYALTHSFASEPVISCLKTDTCQFCAAGARNVCPSANFIVRIFRTMSQ